MADLEQLRAFPLAPPATNDMYAPLLAWLYALLMRFPLLCKRALIRSFTRLLVFYSEIEASSEQPMCRQSKHRQKHLKPWFYDEVMALWL